MVYSKALSWEAKEFYVAILFPKAVTTLSHKASYYLFFVIASKARQSVFYYLLFCLLLISYLLCLTN